MPKYQVGDVVVNKKNVCTQIIGVPDYGIYDLSGYKRHVKERLLGRLISGPTVDEAYAMNERIDFLDKCANDGMKAKTVPVSDDITALGKIANRDAEETEQACDILRLSDSALKEAYHEYLDEDNLNMDGTFKNTPGIGDQCEYAIAGYDTWFECMILDKGEKGVTIHCPHLSEYDRGIQYLFYGSVKFRPLRTDEEREREAFIDEAMQYGSIDPREFLGALYDNNYRKQ